MKNECEGYLSYQNGDIFIGKLTLYFKKKLGKLILSDGSIFEGEFSDDKMWKGIFKFVNGDSFEGMFIDEKMSGKGVYKLSTGDILTGSWSNSTLHGEGTLTSIDGTKYKGLWEYGEFIKWIEEK